MSVARLRFVRATVDEWSWKPVHEAVLRELRPNHAGLPMRSQPIRKYTVAIAMLHTVAGQTHAQERPERDRRPARELLLRIRGSDPDTHEVLTPTEQQTR